MEQDENQTEGQTSIITETKAPSFYKVLLLNDDYTPMDFVVHVLKKFFNKPEAEATEIMMHVHNRGFGVAGIYAHDIAEMKVMQVNSYSERSSYPLKCTMEKE